METSSINDPFRSLAVRESREVGWGLEERTEVGVRLVVKLSEVLLLLFS